jgi:sodium transport system ATP-binding protein
VRSGDPEATGFRATVTGRTGARAMIAIEHLSKRFSVGRGRNARVVDAVREVGLVANDACITGLLGSNGAGKTTTLRMVAGLISPDSGKVEVDGIQVAKRPAAALARMGVLSDSRGLYPRLSARENIVYYGRLHGLSAGGADSRAEELARMFDMTALLDRRSDGFSQGERMKTALARALVHDPPNIVLDEPTNGLDVMATRGLRDCLRRLRDDQGKCIIFSTHIMQEVEKLCDHVVIVAEGRTVATGTVAELRQQTGAVDFEDCFVKLAFGANADRLSRPDAAGSAS